MRPPPREEGRIISYSCALSTVCNVAETAQRSLDRLDIRRFDNKPSAATLCALFKKKPRKKFSDDSTVPASRESPAVSILLVFIQLIVSG